MLIQVIKAFRLVLVVFSLAYFMGSAWYFFTKYTSDFSLNQLQGSDDSYTPESFYSAYVEALSDYDSVMAVTYFAFTTLSTIGYGDLHPKTDAERLAAAVIMLVGVVVFSFIMEAFTRIVLTLKAAYRENGDPGELVKWFKVLKRFNSDKPIDSDLRNEIDEFF